MERELMLSGIGGQGVQLAAQILARAATAERRYVSLFGIYEGVVRGGSTQSTLVFADAPIETPPIVAKTWSLIAMHTHHFADLEAKLRPEGLALFNSDIFEEDPACNGACVAGVKATSVATALGDPMAASMVMVGAYARATSLVSLASLVTAMKVSVPDYRSQHIELNETALEAGFEAIEPLYPAWEN